MLFSDCVKSLGNFIEFANSVQGRGKSTMPPLFNSSDVLSSAYDKTKLIAKNYSKNSNHGDSVSLYLLALLELKLHTFVTSKLVKEVITNLDPSKASGSDFISVVVLKSCELELSYMQGWANVDRGWLVMQNLLRYTRFLGKHSLPDDKEKTLDLQIFSQIGKTMEKLQ